MKQELTFHPSSLNSASTRKILPRDLLGINSPQYSHYTTEDCGDEEEASIESARKSLSHSMTELQQKWNMVTSSSNATSTNARNKTNAEQENDDSDDEEEDDSDNESTLCSTIVANDRQSTSVAQKISVGKDQKATQRVYDGEDDHESADASTLCPTIVANDRQSIGVTAKPMSGNEQKPNPNEYEGMEEDNAGESTLCPTLVAEDRQHSIQAPPPHKQQQKRSPHCTVAKNSEDYETNNDGDESRDESTMCPTVVAQRPAATKLNTSQEVASSSRPLLTSAHQDIFRPRQHDISHVQIYDLPSPSHTVLTMDATMMLEDPDVTSHTVALHHDAASIGDQTPILDRYRITATDDNSVGFKVVPNERGSTRKRLVQISELPSIPKSVKFQGKAAVESHDNNTKYRKTPYKHAGDSLLHMESPPDSSHHIASESAVSPSIHFASNPKTVMPGSSVRRSPAYCRESESSAGFISPNVTSRSRVFPKTPLPPLNATFLDESNEHEEVEESSFSSVKFAVAEETPSKERSATSSYRNTPHHKPVQLPSLPPTVQFGKRTTPAKREVSMYQGTPYYWNNNEEEVPSMRMDPSTVRFMDQYGTKTPRGGHRVVHKKTKGRAKANSSPSQNENLANNATNEIRLRKQPPSMSSSSFRSPLSSFSPAKNTVASTPKNIQLMNNELLRSPGSLASTLTGITTLMHAENQRELFPETHSTRHSRKSEFSSRHKSSLTRITESEYAQADDVMKSQHRLEELNQVVDALNGHAFLEKAVTGSDDLQLRLTSQEAHKILKKCGTKSTRKREKLLKALVCWNRLKMYREVDEFHSEGGFTEYYEVTPA